MAWVPIFWKWQNIFPANFSPNWLVPNFVLTFDWLLGCGSYFCHQVLWLLWLILNKPHRGLIILHSINQSIVQNATPNIWSDFSAQVGTVPRSNHLKWKRMWPNHGVLRPRVDRVRPWLWRIDHCIAWFTLFWNTIVTETCWNIPARLKSQSL